ncbi:MAG: N-acetylgalactosamine 6-sulfate sulfatase [Planctomycetaceae bacterium]|nr:N-acetylgalactosamine 6-sulfate sulfatase [Planctomycetaceae bacterium]MBP62520.1 N-acetylgalactosamine 6-sulfate sulfatase [Planctomycetaceae bacterium]
MQLPRPYLFVLLLVFTVSVAHAAERPNILLIFSDDQGWGDVSCYHSQDIHTPNIDSLARDGVKFTSWYVASSICTPSRFGLLTGHTPSRSQDRLLDALMSLGEEDQSRGIQKDETTVAQILTDQGYDTALIGKWHLGHGDPAFFPTRHGFQSFYGHTAGCIDFFTMRYGIKPDWYRNEQPIDETGYATDLITEQAIQFLQQPRKDKPFFLYLAYNAPHFGKGYDPGKRQVINIMQAKPEDLARVGHVADPTRRVFAAMALSLDDGIGRVLATLRSQSLDDNTLVIFMTDHGADPDYGGSNGPLRGEKSTLFEGGIRVPCLMRWPNKLPAGTTIDAVCSSLDLFPTFCGLAGASSESFQLDGLDLSPLILKNQPGPPRELFWELEKEAALRDGAWKYLRTADAQEYLFHLGSDREETRDLAESHAVRFARMKNRWETLAQQHAATPN